MESVIEKLKIKPIPKKLQHVSVRLMESNDNASLDDLQEVNIDSLLERNRDFIIHDRTKEKQDFDADDFMKRINEMKTVRQNIPKMSRKDENVEEKDVDLEEQVPEVEKKRRKRKVLDVSKPAQTEIASYEIGDELKARLPAAKDIVLIKKPSYYMNNREIFSSFINSLFSEYRKEVVNSGTKVECSKETKQVVTRGKDGTVLSQNQFSLLTHQKIILDYLNIYTPYRGLLLYHGLGSGKTCSSIAVAESHLRAASTIAFAEGIMQSKKVVVMTPASLRVNYFEELKKCGNPIYKKKQYWEFIPLSDEQSVEELSAVLHLPSHYIVAAKGAWMVDVTKESNYEQLSPTQKQELDKQLNEMIHFKYQFINYNGLQRKSMNELTKNNTVNPFDNKVVIIDEAHNFISRIVNKIGKIKAKDIQKYISTNLYHLLMKASNAKIVLLSGTPIINYPNEIGILFNILRGYIKTFHIPIQTGAKKYTDDQFKKILAKHNIVDYLEYKSGILQLTRTPFGFVNKFYGLSYKGTRYVNKEEMNDGLLMENIKAILSKHNISIREKDIKLVYSKALPDQLKEFEELFFDTSNGTMKNTNLFKKRILGLTSYFKSAQEDLMPRYDTLKDTHIVHIPMSDFQFSKYQEIRLLERTQEDKNRKKKLLQSKDMEMYEEMKSTYRIFSRAFCNFVFPDPPGRPMPGETLEDSIANIGDEDKVDAVTLEEKMKTIDGKVNEDDEEDNEGVNYDMESYGVRIKRAMERLDKDKSQLLTGDELMTYSPKYVKMLDHIDEYSGLHLLYSQFRTIEGIGVFSLVLEANGYTRFKIKKNSSQQWVLNSSIEDLKRGKSFALYTGTESAEEKEILRNVFNGTWEYLPLSLVEELKQVHDNNIHGEIVKLFMITASGAEGISLMNTKYVHIMEPYWHPVRTEQVIGRARRICSHVDLPEDEREIKVFYYLMQFTDEQIEKKMNIDIRNNDISKVSKTNLRPLTSDEALFETSQRKENINKQILKSIKEAAIDCSIHSTNNSNELLECYTFGNQVDANVFSYKPNIHDESKDGKQDKLNITKEEWRAKRVKINGIDYALRLDKYGKETDMAYDLDSFLQAQKNPNIPIILVGKIVDRDGRKYIHTDV